MTKCGQKHSLIKKIILYTYITIHVYRKYDITFSFMNTNTRFTIVVFHLRKILFREPNLVKDFQQDSHLWYLMPLWTVQPSAAKTLLQNMQFWIRYDYIIYFSHKSHLWLFCHSWSIMMWFFKEPNLVNCTAKCG